jgi:ElaB/YqjD/DUF883 family membrane-anchored ribosome-binding protein
MADSSKMQGNQGQSGQSRGGGNTGQSGGGVQESAASLAQKAQETASQVSQRAQGLASQAAQRAQEAASAAAARAEGAVSGVGERMGTLADTIRERAPHEGMIGSAASAVADRLEAGGTYLREHDLREMSGDLDAFVRQHPWPSLLACFGLGCLIGMMWKR